MNHEIFLDFVSDVPTALSGSTFRLWQYLIATKAGLELEESAKTNNADKFSKMLTFVGRHVEHLFSSDPISIVFYELFHIPRHPSQGHSQQR